MADPNSPITRFQTWRAALPPVLRLLLTVNVVTYVAYVALSIVGMDGFLRQWLTLPLDLEAMLSRPWTLATYGFVNMYPGIIGLIIFLFAMAWLVWLGRGYEGMYGGYRLFAVYVLSALVGGLVGVAFGELAFGDFVSPQRLGGLGHGAWGAVGGLLCAVAMLTPNRGMGLLFLGVVSMKWIAIGFVVLDIAFVRDPTHLGAFAAGAFFGWAQKRGMDLGAWARPLFGAGHGRGFTMPSPASIFKRKGKSGGSSRRRPAPSRDVDRILDKILEKGYDSLTREERRILEEAGRG